MNFKNILKNIIGVNTIKQIKSKFPSALEKQKVNERRNFYKQFLKPNDIFFDIGANYGNRIEPLINENIKIVAVEPQIECVNFLKKKFGKKITILQNGIGSKMETKIMHISKNANILSSFSKDWIDATKESGRFNNVFWNETREIELLTLDYLIDKYGNPDFIKIDVEGFELEVLKGLTKQIKVLSIEYTVPERKEALLDCLTHLVKQYDSKLLFNYCITEKTEFELPNWVNFDEIKKEISKPTFLSTQFGDVYIKSN